MKVMAFERPEGDLLIDIDIKSADSAMHNSDYGRYIGPIAGHTKVEKSGLPGRPSWVAPTNDIQNMMFTGHIR